MPGLKKRKRAQEKYPCFVCLTDRVSSRFPDVNATKSCAHLINTCTGCLRDHIDQYMNDNGTAGGIRCPQCPEIMKQSDLELVARKKTLSRFIELERRRIANDTPGWQWCLNPKCNSGQVHDEAAKSEEAATRTTRQQSKADVSKDEKTAQPFDCKECHQTFCIACSSPWHVEETCEQYQKRYSDQHAREIAESIKTIGKIAKNCPNQKCRVPTEKDGGCPHIYCTNCHQQWCWSCTTKYVDGQCDCGRAAAARVAAHRAEINRAPAGTNARRADAAVTTTQPQTAPRTTRAQAANQAARGSGA